MAVNIPDIPPNAVSMLFVEDLMKWLLERRANIYCETGNTGRYRKYIFNVFNEDVRQAVYFIDTSIEIEVEEDFNAIEELSEKSFLDYARYCERIHFKKEFQADCFLQYCVRLGSMATRFARCYVPQTISITLRNILKLLEDRGMFKGGWKTFIEVARKYAQISQDCFNVDTPSTSDDETAAQNLNEAQAVSSKIEPPAHSSEDESPVYSSDELQTSSSYDSLDMNEENQTCDYASNRHPLQKPEREFKKDDLSAAREGLLPKRSSTATTNDNFDSGQALEGTSSICELLPSTSERCNASSTSKLIGTNVKIRRETVEKINIRES